MPSSSGAVVTTSGTFTGTMSNGVTSFKGIPYAAPPIGTLRWKPPQPLASIAPGVVAATSFGNICYQHMDTLYATNGAASYPQSEDCLYLNVYAPSDLAGKKPVDIYIHGGAYTTGNGYVFDGTPYAQRGIVFVSFNYRLNIFGYFAHPGLDAESPRHTSGNYGQLDQVAVMQWVRTNIAKFGGDPNNVTIHGQSAGAGAVAAHLVSPLTAGLFKRAILESPYATWRPWHTRATLEAYYAANWPLDSENIATLRALPAQALNSAAPLGSGLLTPEANVYDLSTYNPSVDGYYLPDTDRHLWKSGAFHVVDTLAGNCENEGAAFTLLGDQQWATFATFPTLLSNTYGTNASQATPLYPVSATSPTDPVYQTGFVYGDDWFDYGTRQILNYEAKSWSNVWRYLFISGTSTPTLHSCENGDEFPSSSTTGSAGDPLLSAAIIDTFSQFMKTGNPNGSIVNDWPAYGTNAAYYAITTGGVATPLVGWREGPLQFVDTYTDLRIRRLDDAPSTIGLVV
jgi:para-nitrobenzyl esterase